MAPPWHSPREAGPARRFQLSNCLVFGFWVTNLHDAMVARLASSTLRNRFKVDLNEETSHWEISLSRLSEDEFKVIFAVRLRVASTNWRLVGNSGHTPVRITGLTSSQAPALARTVSLRFRITNRLALE